MFATPLADVAIVWTGVHDIKVKQHLPSWVVQGTGATDRLAMLESLNDALLASRFQDALCSISMASYCGCVGFFVQFSANAFSDVLLCLPLRSVEKAVTLFNSDSSDTFERSPEARVHISLLTSAIVFPTVISNPTRLIASTENKVFCAFTHGGVEDTMLWPWFIEGVGSSTRVHSCLTVKHEDQLQTELSGMQAQPFHTGLPNFDTTGYKAPWAPVALRFLSAQGSRVSIRDSRLKGFGISSPPMASTAPLEVPAAVSELSGGCFGATDSAVYLEGVEFINCVSRFGGGLHVYRGSLEIRDTKFIGCRSTYRGGALGIVGCGTLLHNAAFINNTVASSNGLWSGNNTSAPSDVMGGGAVYGFSVSESSIVVSNSLFQNNSVVPVRARVLDVGGAVEFSFCRFSVSHSTFVHNRVGSAALLVGASEVIMAHGGAMSATRSSGEVVDCDFHHNTATHSGGSIAFTESTGITLEGCNISQSQALTGDGGAVFVGTPFGLHEVGGGNIEYNVALMGHGGGVAIGRPGSTELSKLFRISTTRNGEPIHTNIHYNMARSGGGGGVYVEEALNAASIASGIHFMGNTAAYGWDWATNVRKIEFSVNFSSPAVLPRGNHSTFVPTIIVSSQQLIPSDAVSVIALDEKHQVVEALADASVRIFIERTVEGSASLQRYLVGAFAAFARGVMIPRELKAFSQPGDVLELLAEAQVGSDKFKTEVPIRLQMANCEPGTSLSADKLGCTPCAASE